VGRLGSRVPAFGIKTLSDLQIDVDKDWRAHGIYNLGDLTPKVDRAYNIGSPAAEFDTIYAKAGPPPGADSIGREELREPAVDTAYLYDNAATSAKVGPSVDLEFVRSNDNVIAGGITPKVDGAYNLGTSANKFDTAYATSFPAPSTLIYKTVSGVADTIYGAATNSVPAAFFQNTWTAPFTADIAYQTELQPVKAASIFDHANLGVARAADITYQTELMPVKAASIFDHSNFTVSRGADIAYQSELMPVKFADIFDHPNLGSAKATDIVYHANFNLPSAEARDKVAESAYGMAGDLVGVKGLSKQVTQKRDFTFRTETPNHAYWHRMYSTPAAFETVYQDYTTSMQHKGTTPSKSAPNTADPNPQPGACWSVSMIPDGTQVGGFPSPNFNGMDWEGTYLWGTSDSANYIYQLKTDGTQVGGFASPAPGPQGLAWDGAYVWNGDVSANHIYQLKTDGTQVTGFASPAANPRGVDWDGTYTWVASDGANYIYQLKPDGTQVGGFASPHSAVGSLMWDGTYFWNYSGVPNYIYQLKRDGTKVGGFTPPGPKGSGLAWDGTYFWNGDSTAGYVYQVGNAGNFDVNYRIFAK